MNSTNIKVMSEEIQHLKNEVHNLDVEIPAHPATDVGKYLGVSADGSLAWSDVPSDLPDTTLASAGQILALDSNKDPEWSDNYKLNYSLTEIKTGKTWLNNLDVYRCVIQSELSGAAAVSVDLSSLSIGEIINFGGSLKNVNSNNVNIPFGFYGSDAYKFTGVYEPQTSTFTINKSTGYDGSPCNIIIEYIKATPPSLTFPSPESRSFGDEAPEAEPETETKSTRTKKSTK